MTRGLRHTGVLWLLLLAAVMLALPLVVTSRLV